MNDLRELLQRVAAGAEENLLPEPAGVRAAGDRRTRRTRGVIAAAAAAVVLAGAASAAVIHAKNHAVEPAKPPRLGVTSTLDGLSALPHRIHWQAFPSHKAGIKEVDWFIDGKKDWVEHEPPYFYSSDHSYLVTSFLQPGMHAFTVKFIWSNGQTATHTDTATVSQASAPPAALQGTWKHGINTLVVSSEGWQMYGGPWADVAYPASGIAQVRSWMAAGQRNPYASTTNLLDRWDTAYLYGYLCNNRQGGPGGTKLWSSRDTSQYRWTVTGQHLRLTLVSGHPCGGLQHFLSAPWTKAP